jgi:hypothetical protein
MKRASITTAFLVLAVVCIGAQENPFQGKVFYQTATFGFYEGAVKFDAHLVGRCRFQEDGLYRFEKILKPSDPSPRAFQMIEYKIEQKGFMTLMTFNGVIFWLQNPMPGVYSLTPARGYGREEYRFDCAPAFYLLDENMVPKVSFSPATEDEMVL